MEELEDMLTELTAGRSGRRLKKQSGRPTMDDVRRLKDRLEMLCREVGFDVDWS